MSNDDRDPYVEGYEAHKNGIRVNRYLNMREKQEEAKLFEKGWRDAEVSESAREELTRQAQELKMGYEE